MNDVLAHYKSIPRRALQAEIRKITGDSRVYLWEFVGLNWMYTPVRANRRTALFFGVPEGAVIGYHVDDGQGHVFGGAFGDLMNVEATSEPYPDPFR